MHKSTSFRAGLVQYCATDQASENLEIAIKGITAIAAQGAQLIQLPEMANLMQIDKTKAVETLQECSADEFLQTLQQLCLSLGVWLHVGSLIVPDGTKFFNRGYVIDDKGSIRAHYDKIHLFDVDLANGESYRESASFKGGDKAILVETPWGKLGMAICFDLRFPTLFHDLAQAGATILTAPAAFTATTGNAHWHSLIRARAIENGAIMLACCQGGLHRDGRETYGHSLIIDAWGEILAEGTAEGNQNIVADLDSNQQKVVRTMIPTLNLVQKYTIVQS